MWNATIPGGVRIRALREEAGRTQLSVEVESGLGTGYLQRVESGRVAQPERATLERILEALDARYGDRREILERFGYTVAVTVPTEDEIAWARDVCGPELRDVAFPAYTLDCAHRLIAWNRFVPHLFGVSPDGPLLGGLAKGSFLGAWFDPESPVSSRVADPEAFRPALIRALRYEMQQVHAESWYADLLTQLCEELPLFRRYWDAAEQAPAQVTAARALVPVRLAVLGTGMLQFRLSSEPFARDTRFRVVYLFPADPETMRQCAEWATLIEKS